MAHAKYRNPQIKAPRYMNVGKAQTRCPSLCFVQGNLGTLHLSYTPILPSPNDTSVLFMKHHYIAFPSNKPLHARIHDTLFSNYEEMLNPLILSAETPLYT